MTDPSDATGGDFSGGDDQGITLISPSITTPVQNINGNTYSGAFNFTYQLLANAGSPDTNIVWSLNGIGTLTQSGFYTFPTLNQGQTASGSLVFTVSNNNGSSSQTWNYNIVNTNPPFFTSSQPVALTGNSTNSAVSQSYIFNANRGAPNTESALTWSINPNNEYVVSFTGANDTTRTLQLSFPKDTIASGNYTVSINNANGSASQSWNYTIARDTTDGSGSGGGYWTLQANNSIKNTNANGVRTNGITILDNKIIIHENKLGYIFNISNDIISIAGRPTGFYNDNQLFYYYNEIIDANGMISWLNIKDTPPIPSISDTNAATALGAIGTVLGAVLGGGVAAAVFSERFANWAREFINFDSPIPNVEVSEPTGEPTQPTSKYSFNKLVQKPFYATTSKFGIYTDLYLRESEDVFVLPDAGFNEEPKWALSPNDNRFIQSTSGAFKLIDLTNKIFYGNFTSGAFVLNTNGLSHSGNNILSETRYKAGEFNYSYNGVSYGDQTILDQNGYKAGSWEYRNDGVYYNGVNVLNQFNNTGQDRSSVRLSRVQDGAVQGSTSASTNRLTDFTRRLVSGFTDLTNPTYQPLSGG